MKRNRHPKGRLVTAAMGQALHDINQLLMSLERSELNAVASDLDALSESNCSWLVWRQRGVLKEMVAEAISEKDRVRRANKTRMGMSLDT